MSGDFSVHPSRQYFEHCGRYSFDTDGSTMILRSDLDHLGYYIKPNNCSSHILDGKDVKVWLLGTVTRAGTAYLSVSGAAVNFDIAPFFYTTPLSVFARVLDGLQRKGPLAVVWR